MVLLILTLTQGAGHQVDPFIARYSHFVHYRHNGLPSYILVSLQEDRKIAVSDITLEQGSQFIEVNLIRAIEETFIPADGDHRPLFGIDIGNRSCLRQLHLDSGLQDRCRYHEDNQQNQDDVHQRRHIDLRHRRLSSIFTHTECHNLSSTRLQVKLLSMRFMNSAEKSSISAPNCRRRAMKWL